MTKTRSQTRGGSAIRSVSPTNETIIIDNSETPLVLDHATLFKTLFKTLKYLSDDGIKPAMKAQFTAMQNMFTLRMIKVIDQRIQVLSNIQAQLMNQGIG